TPTRRALNEAFLDQKWLDDLFDCVARLRERRRDGFDTDRTAAVVLRNHGEIAPVHRIEPGAVDFERAARAARDLVGAICCHADAKHAGATVDDLLELGLGIEIEPDRNAEAVAQ